ncbi:hypothetical protein OAH99_02355, partial [Planktomarina sp.]|nr:hypothetical protein [Planktomarina sp.]
YSKAFGSSIVFLLCFGVELAYWKRASKHLGLTLPQEALPSYHAWKEKLIQKRKPYEFHKTKRWGPN